MLLSSILRLADIKPMGGIICAVLQVTTVRCRQLRFCLKAWKSRNKGDMTHPGTPSQEV